MEHTFPSESFQRKTGLPLQQLRLFRKFSSGTDQKRVFHLHPNRNFRNFFVNGKRPVSLVLRNSIIKFLNCINDREKILWRLALK